LVNVLLKKNNFEEVCEESCGAISKTKEIQIEKTEINLNNFNNEKIELVVIDTVGIGDTNLTPQGVLMKLTGVVEEIKKDGLNQIFFVTKGRFTDKEIEVYDLLTFVFGKEILKHTTIVRTSFPRFLNEEKCEEDRKKIREENRRITHIISSVKKIIYVDNLPLDYGEMATQMREKSRVRLLTYLGTCQASYRPNNIAEIEKNILEYTTDKEKLQKLLEESEKSRKEQEVRLYKELRDTENRLESRRREDIRNIEKENERQVNRLNESHRTETNRIREDQKRRENLEEQRLAIEKQRAARELVHQKELQKQAKRQADWAKYEIENKRYLERQANMMPWDRDQGWRKCKKEWISKTEKGNKGNDFPWQLAIIITIGGIVFLGLILLFIRKKRRI